MNRLMSGRGRTVAAVLLLLLVAAACSNASKGSSTTDTGSGSNGPVTTYSGSDYSKHQAVTAPGVSDTEIRVGSIVSKTNPLGTDLSQYNKGLQGYFDMINAKGGVWGRKIKLASERDDQTANNATETDAMLSQDNVYAVFEAVELFTGAPKLAAAGIPTFGWNINPEWAGPKNFFPNIGPVCFSDCAPQPHMAPWVAKQVKATKVGVLAYGVPQAAGCAKGTQDSFTKFGNDVGAHVVFADSSLQFGQTDYSAQVSQMKSKGVDFLVTCMDYNGDFAVAKEMVKQGIRDKVTFMHANMYDQTFVSKNAKYLEGDIMLANITAFEHQPQAAAVKEYVAYAKAHHIQVAELTAQGWISGLQFVNALKAAGPDFTWANLINAWNTQSWYVGDGWNPPIDWTRQHGDPKVATNRGPFECANFVKVGPNGKFVGVWDDNGKPWVCFDGQKPDVWQTPVHVTFATNKPFTFKEAH
ncbi:MAG TPA: ABC transporter substrate-binding protein [Acidimicrobiales bacterium]|jgi:ABC-type branched-subunit amino acid transport system substrate-binding protein|nr:ABC transporter substrate-binding protein [Acidimicrobiales bacterium]